MYPMTWMAMFIAVLLDKRFSLFFLVSIRIQSENCVYRHANIVSRSFQDICDPNTNVKAPEGLDSVVSYAINPITNQGGVDNVTK